MKINALCLLLSLIVAGIAQAQQQPLSVSLIQIIANPEKYNGKFVRIGGYLHNKFEDSGLYLSKDHADRLMGREGIWISYSNKLTLQPKTEEGIRYFDTKWVLLEGIFQYKSENGHGHMGAFSGELKNTTRILENTQYYNGEIELKR